MALRDTRRPVSRTRSSTGAKRIFSASFSSHLPALERMVNRVLRTLVESGSRNGQLAAVELALREALANAVLHGSDGNRQKQVRVECFQHGDGSVLLVVRDHGQGFDPARLEDPTHPENIYRDCGRGIFLIRHFVDQVQFARGGREIRMHKKP